MPREPAEVGHRSARGGVRISASPEESPGKRGLRSSAEHMRESDCDALRRSEGEEAGLMSRQNDGCLAVAVSAPGDDLIHRRGVTAPLLRASSRTRMLRKRTALQWFCRQTEPSTGFPRVSGRVV